MVFVSQLILSRPILIFQKWFGAFVARLSPFTALQWVWFVSNNNKAFDKSIGESLKNFNESEKWINLWVPLPIKEHYSWILLKSTAQIYISNTHLLSNAIYWARTFANHYQQQMYLWFKLIFFLLFFGTLQKLEYFWYPKLQCDEQ